MMGEHYLNLFEVVNASELGCACQLLEVTGLAQTEEYNKHLNLLTRGIASETQRPVALIRREGRALLALPAAATLPGLQRSLGLHVAQLVPLDEQTEYYFSDQGAETRAVAESFLRFALAGQLMRDRRLWGGGRRFFWRRPLRAGGSPSGVDVYEGFGFSLVHMGGRLYVSLDLSHKYVDPMWLTDRLDARGLRPYLMRHALYHFGDDWYPVQIVSGTGMSIGKQLFQNEKTGRAESVFAYTQQRWAGRHIRHVEQLSPDGEAIMYRYPGRNVQRFGAAQLCKLTYSTQAPEARSGHEASILAPQPRFEKLQHIVRDVLSGATLQDARVMLATEPREVPRRVFPVPSHLFGKGKVLHVRPAGNGDAVGLRELARSRLDMLARPDAGPLVEKPFDAQYLVVPTSLAKGIADDFAQRLRETVKRFTGISYRYDLVVYDDAGAQNLQQQVATITEALNRARVARGYLLLVLPTAARAKLHDYLKQTLWPDRQVQCASAAKITSFYRPEHGPQGRPSVPQGSLDKYGSYLRNLAFGLLQVNRKWLWGLADGLHHDVHVGIDVLNQMAGFTFVYSGGTEFYFHDYPSQQKEKLTRRQVKEVLLRRLQEDLPKLARTPQSIVFHRDGRAFDSEIKGIEDAVRQFIARNLLPRDVTWGVVEIHKYSVARLRLVEREGRGGAFRNPTIGAYWALDDRSGIVCTTGFPFSLRGTADPLYVTVVAGNLDIAHVLGDEFALAQLIWSAPGACGRTPVQIRLADDFLRPIAAGGGELEEALYGDVHDDDVAEQEDVEVAARV